MLEQKEGTLRPILGKVGANAQAILTETQAAIAKFRRFPAGSSIFHRASTRSFRRRRKKPKDAGRIYVHRASFTGDCRRKTGDAGRILRSNGITKEDVEKAVVEMRGGSRITDQNAEEIFRRSKIRARFTERARKGKLDPVIGRDDEIRRRFRFYRAERKTIRF
jgi:ATP-dependent Clp protease ATP-binding subunit ClpB